MTPLRGLALSAVTALAIAGAPALSSPASAAPGTLSLVAASADGPAFDLDEYAAADVTVQVTDSVAGPVDVDDSKDLLYFWRITPFDPTLSVARVPATGSDTQATDVTGRFVVPLPGAQPSGTYELVAGLGPDPATSIPGRTVLTVKAGAAAFDFDDDHPLLTAGTDRAVAAALRLEDGTGLPGRLVDLGFTRGSAGTDPQADAGFAPVAPATDPGTALQVTTGAGGSLAIPLSDPAEPGQGTELGGALTADTASTPGIGDAGAGASRDVDVVSTTPPAGSTISVSDLGGGTPGEALAGQVSVLAPDDTFDVDPGTSGVQGDSGTAPDPVVGQVSTLTVDHGAFTTGQPALPSVVGDQAGDLVGLGQTLTGLTDAAGTVEFAVTIGRDKGFDDDGLVSAAVTAVAGGLTATDAAAWDTAHPLNGGQVKVSLSPASEQVAAVAPAVAGNRTYYDVFTLDQFGNRVGAQPVDLTYSGDLDDYDYSDDFVSSDFDSSGDIWVVSFEPGSIDVTGTWNAPTRRYVDAAGGTVVGSADLTGRGTASFYEPDLTASGLTLTSSAGRVADVGSTVTETVRVIDQLGNPVRGYRVQFFRFGPDATSSGEPRVSRTTNAQGRASYSFVGTKPGRSRVTAAVTDGDRVRNVTGVVVFRLPVSARLSAERGGGAAADVVTVDARPRAAGARVVLFRVTKAGRVVVGGRNLDSRGRASFTARDLNTGRLTSYVALVRATATTRADESNSVSVG